MCTCRDELETILEGRRSQPQQLVEVLQDVQEKFRYIPEEAMTVIAKELGTPLIDVFRAANFYKAFSLKPKGENVVTICMGTACHVRGARLLADQAQARLGVAEGETTPDGRFTAEHVNCLGACALGPVVKFNETYHDHVTPGKLRTMIDRADKKKTEVAANDAGKKRKGTGRAAKAAARTR